MSKSELETKKQQVVDRPEKGLAYPLDHLYQATCDICGRGLDMDGSLEYSICAPQGDILRCYCSIDCISHDVQPHIVALLIKHYHEKLQPKRPTE